MKIFFRPIDLAKASGLSVQSIRNYERWGFLPAAERSETGYRRYEQRHLHALTVARTVINGFGWERAQSMMQNVHQRNFAPVFASIDAYHALLHQERQAVEQSLTILTTTTETLHQFVAEQQNGTTFHKKRILRIGDMAQQAGVRVSALRFWEEQGLLKPVRDTESHYRGYDEAQARNVRVIVLLRKVGYNFEAIRSVLDQLATGSSEQVLVAAEQRLAELQERSQRCMEATAMLWKYIQEL